MPDAETFQHFEVLKNPDGSICELGRGAMGVTYKAFDTNLRALVALKVINAAYLDSDVARQRFQREARVAAGLRHPNVAGVFHLGEEGGNYFYAMEFIDGETLEAFVRRRGPLPPALALSLTLQVARALRAAAKVGLVHRDLKPSNLMLSREDEDDADEDLHVKVIDFGLAKMARGDGEAASVSLTGSGILGTPHYISPEQLEEKGLDTRSDIYSLGVTLWYMLTGKPPYSGSMMQVMSKHLNELPPFEKLEGQPPAVCDLLRHMLEKDPAKRPQTPSALRTEIEAALRSLGATPPAAPSGDSGGMTAGAGEALSTAAPAKSPLKSIAIEKPKKSVPTAPKTGDTAPIHVVTRELPRRDAAATSAAANHQPTPVRAGKPVNPALVGIAALAVVVLAGGGFLAWKHFSRPQTVALADHDPKADAPPVAAVPAATAPPPVAAPAATPAPTAAKSPLDEGLAAAKSQLNAGDPAAALLAYTHLLDDFPDSQKAREGVGAALRNLRAIADLPPDIRQPLPEAEQARFVQTRAAAERAADNGSGTAMLYLGDHLIHTEPTVAADWYRKAVAQGLPEAMHQLGNMYRRGIGTATETADYAHWFQEASDKGYPRAKVWLAECYSNGKGGVKQDYAQAFKLLNEAYEAEPNNPAMLEKLGEAYARGNGTPPNPGKAFTLVEQAVELGRPSANSYLGTFYMNGTGTEKDPAKAATYYQRGAAAKDAACMFLYAQCLEKGIGTAADPAQAFTFMQQAVDNDFLPAVGYLGTYYLEGIGLPKPDPEKAAALYRRGAERQDPLCQFRYAQCLERGAGVPADKELATKFYTASAERNYAPAVEWVNQHKPAKARK